jgi:hypothetical protein
MIEKYPFAKCLHPKRIRNQYTGEWLVVPCGKCEACLTVKNSRSALLCDLESECHKYTMFITLTYAPAYLPTFQCVQLEDCETSAELKFEGVDFSTGEVVVPEFSMDLFKLRSLLSKFNTDGDIPYLRKYDLQNFFKRLRNRVAKISKEKVRYFAIGEYGPVHFRPHYHILLWFDDDTIYTQCHNLISASWSFGRIDVQKSEGKCSSYVASYVNSSVFIPALLTGDNCRPFSVHSRFLGHALFAHLRKSVYDLTAREFVKRSVSLHGQAQDITLTRSFYAAYFPKCRGFADGDAHQLYYTYQIYESAREIYPFAETTFDLARCIFIDLNYVHSQPFAVTPACYEKQTHREFVEHFDFYFRSFPHDPENHLFDDNDERIIRNIYKELLLSKHFLEFCCDDSKDYHARIARIERIKAFYSELDYMRLTEFFESQQMWYESDLVGEDFVPFFYDNVTVPMTKLYECKLFKHFCSDRKQLFDKRCKHKVLNDLNKLLFN